MVHSVTAVSRINAVRNDLSQNGNKFQKEQHKSNTSFATILQKEVENTKKEPSRCDFVTYGMDRQVHFFDYELRKRYN